MKNIRLLVDSDLLLMEELTSQKLKSTNTTESIFMSGESMILKFFVLPDNIIGHDKCRCFGYFDGDELLGIIGIRNVENNPSWILSFIITSVDCKKSIFVIKSLMEFVIAHQENKGKFQWFVISKLEKFISWQKLFNGARSNYHHYVYGRVPANTVPKWLEVLRLCGNKLFPYDTNISMYMSKTLCTNNDPNDSDLNFDESDHKFL